MDLAWRRNLLGEPQANLITSGAKPDKPSQFSGINPITLLNFSFRFFNRHLEKLQLHVFTFIYKK